MTGNYQRHFIKLLKRGGFRCFNLMYIIVYNLNELYQVINLSNPSKLHETYYYCYIYYIILYVIYVIIICRIDRIVIYILI